MFCLCLFVCLSVCQQDYSKTRAWIWMKCCLSRDVGTQTNLLTFEPDPYYSPDGGTGLLSRYRISAAMRNFTPGKSHVHVLAAWFLEQAEVLFTELSDNLCWRCALPSAILVYRSMLSKLHFSTILVVLQCCTFYAVNCCIILYFELFTVYCQQDVVKNVMCITVVLPLMVQYH